MPTRIRISSNGAIGFDVKTRPETFKLLTMVANEEEGDTKAAKIFLSSQTGPG